MVRPRLRPRLRVRGWPAGSTREAARCLSAQDDQMCVLLSSPLTSHLPLTLRDHNCHRHPHPRPHHSTPTLDKSLQANEAQHQTKPSQAKPRPTPSQAKPKPSQVTRWARRVRLIAEEYSSLVGRHVDVVRVGRRLHVQEHNWEALGPRCRRPVGLGEGEGRG